MIGGTSGSDTKLCQPCSSQSKSTQTRSVSEGSRKIVAPLEPCCLRFAAPASVKTAMNWSKSSTCVVASSISVSFRRRVLGLRGRCGPSAGEGQRPDLALLRIDRSQALDDLETAAARLGDVHVHAHVVLAGHDGR